MLNKYRFLYFSWFVNLAVVFFIIFCPLIISAQESDDYSEIKNHISRSTLKLDDNSTEVALSKNTNKKENILLLGYRKFLSEQISADCAFDISCSRFSSMAIHSHFIYGIFLTADRLTRCQPFVASKSVPILLNNKTGKVIDEPSMY